MDFKLIRRVGIAVAGIFGVFTASELIGASSELNRAEEAQAKYSAWSNSPDGISVRRTQREIDRIKNTDMMNCYLRHAGPDYDVALDCPQNLAPRAEIAPPQPLNFSSVWDYTVFGKLSRSETSAALFEIHMQAVDYWDMR